MDRVEVELSESPAAPADDTSTCSGGHSPVFDSSAGGISSPVEHLGRGPVAQGLMGSQVVVEPEVSMAEACGATGAD